MHKGLLKLRRILSMGLAALMLAGSFATLPAKLKAEETTTPPPPTRFGVERLDLQPIRYYAFEKAKEVSYGSNYYKYGAGMNLTWALPPEVKANDYFTLKLPREINVDAAPDQRNVFFTIKDPQNPNEVVMHVYFDHRENGQDVLKFVATEYAEKKAGGTKAFRGTAVIGSEIPVSKIKSIWDLDESLANPGNYNKPRTSIDQNQKYYQGFRPNYEYFNNSPVNGDVCNHQATLTYETKYMNGPAFTLQDETSVSYKSQLFYDGYRYTRFGDFMIQPIEEDQESITFMILYNVAGTGQAAGKVTKEFNLNNTGFGRLAGYRQLPANLTPWTGSYTTSMQMWKARPGQGTPFPKDRESVDPATLKETDLGSRPQPHRINAAQFTFPDQDNTYVIKLKMRKHENKIATPSGEPGWFLAASQSRSIRNFLIEDFYHGTTGTGDAILEETPEEEFAQVPLSIRKVDGKGQVIKNAEVTFLLQDKETEYSVTKSLGDNGEVVFNGLFLNHNYLLMETQGAPGYDQQPEPFELSVDAQGAIHFKDQRNIIKQRTDLAPEVNAYSFDFVNLKADEKLGYFKVVHKYYDNMKDLEAQQNEAHKEEGTETSGPDSEQYEATSQKAYQDYRFVRVERSDNEKIALGEDGRSTKAGNYVPGTHLQVTYLYVKPGVFNEVHLYYDSREKAEAGVPDQAEEKVENPRTTTSQTGLAEDEFTSQKSDKDGYTLLKASTDEPTLEPNQDGAQATGNFIPGTTVTHTYYYYRTPAPKGSFKVVHKYFNTVEDLEGDKNAVREESEDKTEGTDKEQFRGSSPKQDNDYGFVKLVRSDEEHIPTGDDNNSTVPGHYVPNKDLVVTYYYLKLGQFKEVHKYYNSEEDAQQGNNPAQTIENPRTDSKNQKGLNTASFTSQKHDKENYTLLRVETDNQAAQPQQDGSESTGNFIPGTTITHTYHYYRSEDPNEPGDGEDPEGKKGSFKVVHKYYDSQEALDAGTPVARETLGENSAGTATESYGASEKVEIEGYSFVRVDRSHPEAIQLGEDEESTKAGHYIPNEALVVTYHYLKPSTEPDEPQPDPKGSFLVIHKYFDTVENLEADKDAVREESEDKTEGTDKEQFRGSSPKQDEEYGYVKLVRSDENDIPTGDDNNSTVPGNYVPNKDLVVTYYYLKLGQFKEVHKYYESEDVYKAEGEPEETVENPRTENKNQKGLNTESFTSEKKDKQGYTLVKVTTDREDLKPKDDGSQSTGNFIPGVTVTHTYYYIPETGSVETEPKGTFKVIHKYYNSEEALKAGTPVAKEVAGESSEGPASETYGKSGKQESDGYKFVRVDRSHPEAIQLGEDGKSTKAGNYIPNENLVVTYHYLKQSTEPDEPGEPGGNQPSQPGGNEPSQPSGNEPSQPGGNEPSQPSGNEPSQPSGNQPSKPGGNQPSKPTKPTNPSGNQPSNPGGNNPNHPGGNNPNTPGAYAPNQSGSSEADKHIPVTGESSSAATFVICISLGAVVIYLRRRHLEQ